MDDTVPTPAPDAAPYNPPPVPYPPLQPVELAPVSPVSPLEEEPEQDVDEPESQFVSPPAPPVSESDGAAPDGAESDGARQGEKDEEDEKDEWDEKDETPTSEIPTVDTEPDEPESQLVPPPAPEPAEPESTESEPAEFESESWDSKASAADTVDTEPAVVESVTDTSHASDAGTASSYVSQTPDVTALQSSVDELSAEVSESFTAVTASLDALNQLFTRRLQYDDEKETVIDRQHDELTELREGVLKNLVRPVLYDIAEALDDIRKMREHYAQTPFAEAAVKALDDVDEQLVYILEKNDVERVSTLPGEKFVAARHRMIKHIDTTDPEKGGTVARSIAPGYMMGKETLFKEKVVVYRSVKSSEPQA